VTKRARVLVASATSLVLLIGVALLLPVPFVKMSPGPTYNVVGEVGGVPVIDIEGTQVFPTTGELDMTTVMESGGPRGGSPSSRPSAPGSTRRMRCCRVSCCTRTTSAART
jgi:PDZ domain-containing protein